MPRMARMNAPGSLVHIIGRGINGIMIFRDNEDHLEFLKRFTLHKSDCGYKCLAWCLMPNHYHLLLRTTEKPISSLMRPLNGGYAQWYNKKYTRNGYLFQDRYKSVICQDTEYAIELIRYIHLNPIRAGFISSLKALKSWKWCGHAFLLKMKEAIGDQFQDRLETLRRFGENSERAVIKYLQFLSVGINQENLANAGELRATEAFEVSGSFKGWPAVIGDAEFARSAMEHYGVIHRRKHRQADYNKVLKKIADLVCQDYKINMMELFKKGRANIRSMARAQFCYRAHFEELLPFGVIAKFLSLTIPPVTVLAHRLEKDNAQK